MRYLEDCFKSIEQQTYKNWEICVCNDADHIFESAEYVRNYHLKYSSQVRLVNHSENKGICEATKSALKLATGEYAIFMDADDVLHKRALECLANSIGSNEAEEVDFIYTNHDHMTDWGLRIKPMYKPAWSPELLMHVNYINHLACAKIKFLQEISEDLFQNYTTGAQDWDLCLRLVLHAKKVRHIPLILYHWRSRPGSMAESYIAKPWAAMNQLEVRKKLAPNFGSGIEFDPTSSAYKYFGSYKLKLINLQIFSSPYELLAKLINLTTNPVKTEIFYFANMDSENLTINELITYCNLDGVACVWPFLDLSLRTAYTFGDYQTLVPLSFSRSTFSQFSGNVLTGPINGLAIQSSKLNECLRWLSTNLSKDELEEIFSNNDINIVGAVIGLAALNLNYRNMSANKITLNQEIKPIKVPTSLIPFTDGYI